MTLSLGITSYAASGADYAYVYGFDYGDHVNTTAIAAQQQMYLNNLGYTTYCNTNVGASFAVGDSPNTNDSRMNSAVVVFNGHAGAGSYQMVSNGNNSYLTGKKSGGDYYKFNNVDMDNTKMAIFMGCKTSSTSRDSTYGTLTDDAVSCGAESAFGWEKSVDTTHATNFRERLFYFLRYGYTLSDASANAASEMPWFSDTKDYRISGDGSTVLTRSSRMLLEDNSYDYETALNLVESENYKLHTENSSGTQTYVKYIDDLATSESIDINRNEKWAIQSKDTFTGDELSSLVMPINEFDIDSYSGSDTITSGGNIFSKINEEFLNVIVKIEDMPVLVGIVSTEYESDNGLSYMTEKYINMHTGEELSFNDIFE